MANCRLKGMIYTMLAWLSQYIGTIIIIAVLVVIVALIIRSLIKQKKSGKSCCGGSCKGCGGSCHMHDAGKK